MIASRYEVSPSAADVLDEPILVCRATGTTVVPREHSRVAQLGRSADADGIDSSKD